MEPFLLKTLVSGFAKAFYIIIQLGGGSQNLIRWQKGPERFFRGTCPLKAGRCTLIAVQYLLYIYFTPRPALPISNSTSSRMISLRPLVIVHPQ